MTLKPLLSLLRSREQCQAREQGLLIARRLKELLENVESTPMNTSEQTPCITASSHEQKFH